jgi:hypothetical protein
MTQVMDLTVKIWPGLGKAMELEKWTIWLAKDSARTPPTYCATIDEICSAVYRGVPTVVDESVEVRVRELDGDTERKRQRLGRFGPSA